MANINNPLKNSFNDEIVDIKKQSLYARLKRLFSTDVIVRNVGGKQLNIKDTDNVMQATDRNSLRDRFNRIRSTAYNAYSRDFSLSYQASRMDLFRDYDTMDQDPIISSALDIYADECLTYNELGKVLTIHSNNNNVKQILENLFNDILNIQFNLWSWVRNMPVKYDSYIPLLSGENIRIDELSQRLSKGEEIWVYSIQDNTHKIVPGKVIWCDKNYTSNIIVKVIFDDDTFVETSPEHPFILRNGTEKFADQLKPNDSLMPFYRKLGINNQELIYNPQSNCYDYSHILIDNKYKSKKSKKLATLNNHKVKDVQIINEANDVYCMTVVGPNGEHDRHNFAICGKTNDGDINKNSGVFVKNCKYGDFYLKLYITPEYGIYMVEPITAYNVERIENSDPYNKRYVKFQVRPTDTSQSEVLENYEVAHFRHMSDSNFLPYGKCLTANSYIKTKVGSKKINEIQVNDEIWSFNIKSGEFELTRVINKCESGIKDILKISSKNTSIECSNEHPILIYFNGEFKYKLAIDIKIGDLLVTSNLDRLNQYDSQSSYEFVKNDELIFEPVECIVVKDPEETYDIQVESYNSNFIANGIVVHNSIIEGGRRVWKQLSLMEDAMLIHRIMRAPEKRVFYSDIGGIHPSEIDMFMEKMSNKLKKVPYMDEKTGEYNLRFNLQNMIEDYVIPVRGSDSGTKIETLGGMDWTGTEDIEYLKNKMMSALKIPKAFLGFDEAMGGKATLACIVPETEIPLINGKIKTVKELIDDYHNGIINYVYSYDENTKTIVAGEISWAGFTRLNTNVIRVHLDNNKYIDCTPDHRFMLRDGKWVEAKDLLPDQSLMPLYIKTKIMDDGSEYQQYLNPTTNTWEFTHNLSVIDINHQSEYNNCDVLYNHKVKNIEILFENRDTCDITIKKYHNFATNAGVIIHNSEDVRFARTIQRLQRIICSELNKIAIVHLYTQGYRDESLIDFELELTNPSTIFEKEKIEIWSDKISVATDMVENKFFSYNWAYKTIFNMSEDDINIIREQIIEDSKQKYRLNSIEDEGIDPAKPFKKVGSGDGGGGGGGSGGGGGGGLSGGLGSLGSDDLKDIGLDDEDNTDSGDKDELDIDNLTGDEDNKDVEDQTPDDEDNKDVEDLVKEDTEVVDDRDRSDREQERDQSGKHKSNVRLEDPLGHHLRNSKPKSKSEGKPVSAITHNFEKSSPLRLQEIDHKLNLNTLMESDTIIKLSEFLSKNSKDIKKELIKESITNNKSMLNEDNILE